MSHSHVASGWESIPTTAGAWTDRWTLERGLRVPGRRGGEVWIEARNIAPVPPGTVPGDPDLFVTAADGRQFYVLFLRVPVVRPISKPLLVWPPDRGGNGAFWVLPA